jgi:pyruvate formate lyase activating enzyme
MQQSLIFDIKRYAINDGPGIRVVIFFKGCNLHCAWCHNPEGISAEPEKMYSEAKCIRCGTCVAACPEKALSMNPDGIVTHPGQCNLCGLCADVCPTKAMEMSGKVMSVEEIMEIVEKERVFMDQSGGGVTFSGGEPLLHNELLISLLKECRNRNIHTAVDTCGFSNPLTLAEVAELTDLFLYDLKILNSTLHKAFTGVPNDSIISNLKMLAESGKEIIIRIPLIEGVNTDTENVMATAKLISSLPPNAHTIQLLPYHETASAKYLKLGTPIPGKTLKTPSKELSASIGQIFRRYNLKVSVAGY